MRDSERDRNRGHNPSPRLAAFLRRFIGLPDPTLPEPLPVARWPKHLWR